MRLAALQPSISITLSALGRLDHLCTCSRYCLEALPELAIHKLPVLADSWTFDRSPANTDTLLAARPDLVVTSVPYRIESLAAVLKTGLPVLTLAPHTLADIYKDIRILASLVDARPEGEALIAEMHHRLAVTRALMQQSPRARPLIYCEEWGKPLIHSQYWVAELVDAANGRFLGTPGAHTTPEVVAAADPDVLLFAWCGAGDRVPLARVIEQRQWHHLRAARNGRVHCIPDECLNTPAPALLEGLAMIAAALHPTLVPAHPRLITLASAALTASPPDRTL